MRVQTGQGTITLMTLVAIWSISALTALPGLAISPVLGKLSTIFPHSTELDIQMLSSLPSLLIIPFVIVTGKLAERINTIRLLQIGLLLFALSGFLYLISEKMWQLIAVSALMGVGSGLIIPLSTGLISRFFTGKYRTKQFGLSSAITNVTLVVATGITGFLAEKNWHLPFVVYLLPIVSIALLGYLKKGMDNHPEIAFRQEEKGSASTGLTSGAIPGKYGIDIRHLLQIMGFYGLITYIVIIISFNLPFLMEEYKFSSGSSGLMISLFFLAIMAPGFVLNQIVGLLRKKTKFVCLLAIAIGLGLILISHAEWMIGLGCVLIGLGYGVMQPVAYDKTTRTANPGKVTLALAFVMAMNYLAILLCPFIIDFFQSLFDATSQRFAFIFNLGITIVAMIWAYVRQDSFLFNDKL